MMRAGHREEVAGTLGEARRSGRAALAALLVSAGLALGGSPPAGALAPEPQDAGDPVVAVAGDIADCGAGAAETAALLDDLPGTVLTVGDNVYPTGSAADYRACYEPTWGRHKARTRPSPGNHDYDQPRAAPYFAYFGANAGPEGRGYYSFDLGAWHLVSLNSNVAAEAGSAQERWLRADLAAHPAPCALAYWHHPLFSSGAHGNDPRMHDVWRVLYAFGVDVVLNGHDHGYERFGRQDPDGGADPERGIREFVVGTGGAAPRPFGAVQANSRVQGSFVQGVLKLTLGQAGYEWQFVPVPGQAFLDAGSGTCGASVSVSQDDAPAQAEE
jgi:3',5'-cyclic AMP phosphodiesterase CpdA